jgi:hypothetical protein
VFFVSDVATKLGACIPGAGIPQVMEIGVEQVMRDGSLEDIFPDWLDERLAVCALFVSAPSSWRVEVFINFRLELSSSAASVAHCQIIRRRNVGSAKAWVRASQRPLRLIPKLRTEAQGPTRRQLQLSVRTWVHYLLMLVFQNWRAMISKLTIGADLVQAGCPQMGHHANPHQLGQTEWCVLPLTTIRNVRWIVPR